MESLNLHSLSTTLNAPNPEFNDKELIKDFKVAAQSLTTLYRSARQSSKRAYDAGYIAACEDLLSMIQTGVSLSVSGASTSAGSSSEMGIGKIMDWVEARLDAVKARQEEELEEEATKAPLKANSMQPTSSPRLRTRSSASPPPPPPPPQAPPSNAATSVLTPLTTPNGATVITGSSGCKRQPKLRGTTTHAVLPTPPPSSSPNLSSSFPNPPLLLDDSPSSILGTKRRHAVMLLDSISSSSGVAGASPSSTPSSSSRRRTRSWRNQNVNLNLTDGLDTMMDVVEEEGGRERKRVQLNGSRRS